MSTEKQIQAALEIGAIFKLDGGTKFPPPDGVTGDQTDPAKRKVFSKRSIVRHVQAGGNYGVVPHPEYVVIDIDAYKSPSHWKAATDFMLAHPLPPTLRISSRYDECEISGHYWFKLPKEYSWNEVRLRASLNQNLVKFADIIHHRLRYVVGAGSWKYNAKEEKVKYKVVSETTEIAELPMEIYELLKKPPPTKVTPRPDGTYDPEIIQMAVYSYRNSKMRFRFAREGDRHMSGFGASRDLGKLYAMGGITEKQYNKQLAVLIGIAKKNGVAADSLSASAIRKIAKDGIERVVQHQEGPPDPLDEESEHLFWHTRAQYEACMFRAAKLRVHPMGTLLSDLTVLASHLDHRVSVQVDPTMPPMSLNLFTMLIGKPAAGKSNTWSDSYNWGTDLPYLTTSMRYAPGVAHEDTLDVEDKLTKAQRKMTMLPVPRSCAPKTGPAIANWLTGQVPQKYKDDKGNEKVRMVKRQVKWRMLIHHDEPDDLFAGVGKAFSLHPILRSAFKCDEINPQTATDGGAFLIFSRNYSINLLTSMLPEMIGSVEDWKGTGLFQRFLYCDVGDRDRDLYKEVVTKWDETYADKSKRRTTGEWPLGKYGLTARFSPEVYADTRNMLEWADGAPNEEFSEEDRARWLSMSYNGSEVTLLDHLVPKLLRVAALLAMYNGEKPSPSGPKGHLIVEDKYYQDAQVVLRHSARAIAKHLRESRAREVAAAEARGRNRAIEDLASAKHKKAQMTREQRLIDYLKERGGAMAQRELLQKCRHIVPNVRILKEVVHNSEELEIIGKPAIVKLKSVGQQSWTFNDKKEQS